MRISPALTPIPDPGLWGPGWRSPGSKGKKTPEPPRAAPPPGPIPSSDGSSILPTTQAKTFSVFQSCHSRTCSTSKWELKFDFFLSSP